ncbi:lipopolysaccharide biosynthesis protein [Caldicellulosiruptor acetigenus I77R1B]|uniref:Lipopolysaccharide biosynthesis protein n=1 Tax=Caldicellulosiruptor acetigenus (strain ATCC 700853 / DSM 12137 / I77R1B) TaxID=632335 RepID=E4S7Y7_CALA7|nr:GNVR domain-containing protein [Caldicellulosiruptor acetigenus]ADQ41887.1 lipopolysaccharide biosynthesis protein [Caldicellulosiruptor acetigenus I77R1B]
MEVKEYFLIIRKRIILIITTTILSSLIAAILSFYVLEPVYRASVTLFAGRSTNNSASSDSIQALYSDVLLGQQLVKDYREIAVSRTVLERVIKELNLKISIDQLKSMVSVQLKNDTRILMINIESKDPKYAALIANKLAEVFIEAVQKIMKIENVQIVDKAVVPEKPERPKKALNIAIAFVVGLLIGVGLAFFIEYLDNTIKTPDDVEKFLQLPVLAVIPDLEKVERN